MTPNQIVAFNLARARELRGWTQDEAAQRLEPYVGQLWSRATFSAAERGAVTGERVRQFTADDIAALSLAFELPVTWFLVPPPSKEVDVELPSGQALSPAAFVDVVFGASVDLQQRLSETIRAIELSDDQRATQTAQGSLLREALARSVGDIDEWVGRLRELADSMEQSGVELDEEQEHALGMDLIADEHRGQP